MSTGSPSTSAWGISAATSSSSSAVGDALLKLESWVTAILAYPYSRRTDRLLFTCYANDGFFQG
jgi:hypothetical protein